MDLTFSPDDGHTWFNLHVLAMSEWEHRGWSSSGMSIDGSLASLTRTVIKDGKSVVQFLAGTLTVVKRTGFAADGIVIRAAMPEHESAFHTQPSSPLETTTGLLID